MANKYIYELYRASDGRFNVEQRTIIYQNSEYIYFKNGTSKELGKVYINNVYNSIQEIPRHFFDGASMISSSKYLYLYDKNKDKKILDNRTTYKYKLDILSKIHELKEDIQGYQDKINYLNEELARYESKLKELKSEESNEK